MPPRRSSKRSRDAGAHALTMQALSGLRVVELGALIAGPFCGKILAEFGADVVKVEPPGQGDPMRKWRQHARRHVGVVARAVAQQAIGRRRPAQARRPGDRARADRERADIVVENFRPGTLEGWGLGYDALRAGNPGLVMVRISGYGQTGPYSTRAGFGVIGEAMGGLRYVTGTPDRPPSRTGISIGDTLVGAVRRDRRADGARAAPPHRQRPGRRRRALRVGVLGHGDRCCPNSTRSAWCASAPARSCRASRRPRPTAATTAASADRRQRRFDLSPPGARDGTR